MGWFQKLTDWADRRHEKYMAKMRSRGQCPGCAGNGFHPASMMDGMYFGLYHDYRCPGCGGSGRYEDWEEGRTDEYGTFSDADRLT